MGTRVKLSNNFGRRILLGLLLAALLALLAMQGAGALVRGAAAGRTYADTATIPARKVGLVLGCAGRLVDGQRNLFFIHLLRTRPHFLGPRIQIGLAVFPWIGKGSPFFFRLGENGRS